MAVYQLPGLRPAECSVRISAMGFISPAAQLVQLSLEQTAKLEFRLVARPILTVRVVDEFDQPVGGALLRLLGADAEETGTVWHCIDVETDSTGLAQIAPNVTDVLVIQSEGYATAFATQLVATSEKQVRTIQLIRPGSLELTLIDLEGKSVDDVEVECAVRRPVPIAGLNHQQTQSVSAGRCRFEGLEACEYTLRLTRDAMNLDVLTVTLGPAENMLLTHTLAPSTTVTGSVSINQTPAPFSEVVVSDWRGVIARTETDARGQFSVTVRSDSRERRYVVEPPDAEARCEFGTSLIGNKVDLSFQTAQLRLKVLDPAARPVANLHVELQNGDGGSCLFQTDEDGAWHEELPFGVYRLVYWYKIGDIPGFLREELVAPHDAIELTQDTDHVLRFEAAIPLKIEIVDPDGLPFGGEVEKLVGTLNGDESVQLHPAAGIQRWAWPASARRGVAFVANYPPQVFHVARPDASRVQRVMMTPGGVLRVPPTPALDGVTLRILALDGGFIPQHARTWRLTVSHAAEWLLTPGRYRITATHRDGAPFERTATVIAGETVAVE
ncbi:MAG: hypothetical protein ACKVX7_17310 [Planctomycetota bacterium]